MRRKRTTALDQIEIVFDLLSNRFPELMNRFAVLREGNLIIRD